MYKKNFLRLRRFTSFFDKASHIVTINSHIVAINSHIFTIKYPGRDCKKLFFNNGISDFFEIYYLILHKYHYELFDILLIFENSPQPSVLFSYLLLPN